MRGLFWGSGDRPAAACPHASPHRRQPGAPAPQPTTGLENRRGRDAILMYGFGDANEPEEIERLLRCAGLPLLEAPDVEKKERRAKREAELGELQRALPTKRYGVILADPPWRFEPYSRATGMDCAANSHYPTSGLEEIKALDVASIAAPDCVLFLWATVPMLPQAHEAMAAWGFKYNRTSLG